MLPMSTIPACTLCPRGCGVYRSEGRDGKLGFCGQGGKIKIARWGPHHWEEPCISGDKGSGAVFFSGCTLRCVYCQNREISHGGKGIELSASELAERFLKLEAMGVHNINLVTPTQHLPGIIEALEIAESKGLNLPVVYNCGGYEKVETVKMLGGIADVYLPDFKYFSGDLARKYSGAEDYPKIAAAALKEMVKQTGPVAFDEKGMIKSGVIVRHLMLPGLLFDSKKVIDFLYKTYGEDIYISLMSQYTVMPGVGEKFPELGKNLNRDHYEALVDYCRDLGMENMYIQEDGAEGAEFIPEFYGEQM